MDPNRSVLSKVGACLSTASQTESRRAKIAKRRGRQLRLETLESRKLLTATLAISSGDWTDASIWSNGVPDASKRAIISQGRTVTLNSVDHVAEEIVIHGQLVAEEGAVGSPDKSLTTRWIHVNSGGVFQVGTEADRYDNHDFDLTLTGTNPNADFTVETATGTMSITNNDGFLMTAMGGSLQFYGDQKLSFTKLAKTAWKGSTTITVENVIERNFDGTTSAASDGSLDGSNAWQVGDQIVIASSSANYAEEDVRTITGVDVQGSETVLTLNSPTTHRHYGFIEYYKDGQESIDLRAEVALLSRSITIQGTQDTDSRFGNRARYGTTSGMNLGIGAHAMFMPGSGTITIDSVQFDKMGQTGQVGRYPIHWHLGANRSGDILRNSSVTNSNNRGVVVHGAQGLLIEGNVLHDIHGHGLFMEDGAEFNNQFLSNIVLGIHRVGGNNRNDPFIVPGVTRGSDGRVNGAAPRNGLGESSHDTGQQVFERFLSSSAYWITNPDNTWIGNVSAGSEGTGFWFILPDRVIGLSRDTGLYNGYNPAQQNLGVFDHNTSHSSPVGLTFDRGSDIRGGGSVGYTPPQRATFNEFTGYKHTGTAVYHRGNNVTFSGSQFADVKSGSFNTFSQIEQDVLFVGHSRGNSSPSQLVGGYKLYDGPGQIIGAHFAGFSADNAHMFLNTGGAHKHAMTRAEGITFEDDGTADHVSIYWQDAGGFTNDSPANAAGRPDAISGIVLDVDGSLTGHGGGGAGHVLTPRVDYYRDSTDIRPAGWNAYISDDRFGYLQLETISGAGNFPYFDVRNGDDHRLRVNRRNITRQRLYTKLNAGDYTFTFTEPVPADGFTVRMDVLRGSQPGDSTVYRFEGVGTDYQPTSGIASTSLQALRSASSNAFFRDADGDLWMKVFENNSTIRVRPTNNPLPSNDAEVENLVLVNADNEEDITELVDGSVINLTTLPTRNLNVRAAANETTRSIGFSLVGPSAHNQTESLQPYSLFGDTNGDFQSEPLLVGQYTLVVTPYTQGGLSGTAGEPVTINFEVIEPVQSQFTGITEDPTVKDGTVVRAEEFDEGGQGVAYFDTSAGNSGSGNNARPDEDVDLTNSSILLSNVIDGEWLEFTRDVAAGIYDVSFNVNQFSVRFPEKGIRLLVAENAFSNSFTELGAVRIPDPNVTGTTFVIPDVDLTQWGGAGRVFRVEFFAVPPDTIIAPQSVQLVGEAEPGSGPYLEYGTNGDNWFNGSGLSDASIVETGDPIPAQWPTHIAGNSADRVSRIRSAAVENALIFDLGGTFDISGMALWNSTEGGQTDRGFENTQWFYSTDGGQSFIESENLTWTDRAADGASNQGNSPPPTAPVFRPEVQMLSEDIRGVTHVQLVVDNFSNAGADGIVMASELRFIGKSTVSTGTNLSLNFDSLVFTNADQLDFGDAPATYPTLLANDGARHAAIGPQLGATRDAENDGGPSVAADGDGSDEDGVLFGGIGVDRNEAAVNIMLGGSSPGLVDAWIDFNRDGDWDDSGEQILTSVMVDQSMQTLNYDLPAGLTAGDTFARVRISTDGELEPNGFAKDGEVEDYVVSIVAPPKVESIIVNDGDTQRSSLDSVSVMFDQAIDDTPGRDSAFQLIDIESGEAIAINTPQYRSTTDGKTIVDLTFDPSDARVTSFGSLQDGDYQLVIDASLVMRNGVGIDGNGGGLSGGDYATTEIDKLFRKYGDADGDGTVGLTDFAAFRGTFGKSEIDPGYFRGLDSDGVGGIGLSDFAAFRSNFGK
jgi:hypothetical protein